MANAFDAIDELGGVFSKLKKAVKKTTKKIEGAGKKVFPKNVRKVAAKIRKSKAYKTAIKIAAVGVAAYLGAPLLGKLAASGLGASMSSAASSLTSSALGKTIIDKVGTGAVRKVIGDYAKKSQKKAVKKADADRNKLAGDIAQRLAQQTSRDASIIKQISSDPDFKTAISQRLQDGWTYDQILAEWSKSETFKTLAGTETAKTVSAQLYGEMVAQGVPKEYAKDLADVEAKKITDNELAKLTGSIGKIAMIAAPLALFLMR